MDLSLSFCVCADMSAFEMGKLVGGESRSAKGE